MKKSRLKPCKSRCDISGLSCQGVRHHGGWHWSYNGLASYCTWRTRRPNGKKLRRFDVASEQCPIGHDHYVTPAFAYLASYAYAKVVEYRAESARREKRRK